MYNWLHPAYWFGDVDARPFALFRIGFGALMLKEALYGLIAARTFYTDSGVLPRSALSVLGIDRFSLLNVLPADWMVLIFFSVWVLVALGLLLGFHTRWMTILNFLLLISTVNRNPLIASGAETAQCAYAFWALFVPLGRCYSLDARRAGNVNPNIYAFPPRMIQLQIVIIYVFSTLIKLQGHSWLDGTALYKALQVTLYTFPLGNSLVANVSPDVLRLLTHFSLLIEAAFPLLAFTPFGQPYLRAVALLSGLGLHLGIGAAMNIPNFPAIMLISYLTLLDPRWLDWVENQLTKRRGLVFTRSASQTVDDNLLFAFVGGALQGALRGAFALVVAVCVGLVLWGNILNNDRIANDVGAVAMPANLDNLLHNLNLSQSWSLFAPEPLPVDSWFKLAGTFNDGQVLDLRTGESPGTARPHYYFGPWARWNKFEENLMRSDAQSPALVGWADYACRTTPNLQSVQMILRSRPTVAPGEPIQAYTDRVLMSKTC